jgi:hypothetical protein
MDFLADDIYPRENIVSRIVKRSLSESIMRRQKLSVSTVSNI